MHKLIRFLFCLLFNFRSEEQRSFEAYLEDGSISHDDAVGVSSIPENALNDY